MKLVDAEFVQFFFIIIIVLTDVQFFSEEFDGFLLIGNYFIKIYDKMIGIIIKMVEAIINFV